MNFLLSNMSAQNNLSPFLEPVQYMDSYASHEGLVEK